MRKIEESPDGSVKITDLDTGQVEEKGKREVANNTTILEVKRGKQTRTRQKKA